MILGVLSSGRSGQRTAGPARAWKPVSLPRMTPGERVKYEHLAPKCAYEKCFSRDDPAVRLEMADGTSREYCSVHAKVAISMLNGEARRSTIVSTAWNQ